MALSHVVLYEISKTNDILYQNSEFDVNRIAKKVVIGV